MAIKLPFLTGGGFQAPPSSQVKGSPMFDMTYGRSMGKDNRPVGMIRNPDFIRLFIPIGRK